MALYDKPVRTLFWDMVADMSLQKGEILTRQQVNDWFDTKYPKVKPATIAAHLIRLSVNAPSRHHYSAKPVEDDLLYQLDSSRFRLYDATVDPPPVIQGIESPGDPEPEEDADTLTGAEFAT